MVTKDIEVKETGLHNRNKIINIIHTYIDITNPTLCRKLNNRYNEADIRAARNILWYRNVIIKETDNILLMGKGERISFRGFSCSIRRHHCLFRRHCFREAQQWWACIWDFIQAFWDMAWSHFRLVSFWSGSTNTQSLRLSGFIPLFVRCRNSLLYIDRRGKGQSRLLWYSRKRGSPDITNWRKLQQYCRPSLGWGSLWVK